MNKNTETTESNRVYIFDTTLRDGAQTPFIGMGFKERYLIAKALAYVGVDVIEAGFAANNVDYGIIQVIAENLGRSKNSPIICSLARAILEDIELAYESLKPAIPSKRRIHTFIGTSEELMNDSHGKREKMVLKMVEDSVCLAKKLVGPNGQVQYSSEDSMRTDRDFLIETIQVAVDSGADIINIPDTTGFATPDQYYKAVRDIKEKVNRIDDVILSTHIHHDSGNTIPLTMKGLEAGIRQVEGCVLQLGERAGNTDWMTVVANILFRDPKNIPYDVSHIKAKEFYDLAQLVSSTIGNDIPLNHPVVGRAACAESSGIHVKGVLKNPKTYFVIDPNDIGREVEIVLGQTSGSNTVANFLRHHGYGDLDNGFTEDRVERMTTAVKECSMKIKGSLNETESKLLAEHYVKGKPYDKEVKLVYWRSMDEKDGRPKFEVHVNVEGKVKVGRAEGDGPVDGFMNAMKAALSIKGNGIELKDWQEHAEYYGFGAPGYDILDKLDLSPTEKTMLSLSNGGSKGQQALAHSVVEITHNGKSYHGRGFSQKITEATYEAIADAFDAMYRLNENPQN
ncbi:alpha-isopropylmalate synthase regulatory domain-containing protein [Thermoproteota archaeon]